MGILLDTTKMQARLPLDKIQKILASFEQFERKKSCTLHDLQSLTGTLNFASKVVSVFNGPSILYRKAIDLLTAEIVHIVRSLKTTWCNKIGKGNGKVDLLISDSFIFIHCFVP